MKPGNIVKLKSGSYHMTVAAVIGSNVDCVWFDCPATNQYGALNRNTFSDHLLVLVEGDPEPTLTIGS